MHTSAPGNNEHSRLQALLDQAPSVTGVLALGVGLTASGAADAALIIQDINLTADGNFFDFDLDQDGIDDFRLEDGMKFGESFATIGKQVATAGVLKKDSFAAMLAEGDEVSGASGGFSSSAQLFRDIDGPWATLGAHGYAGLTITIDADVHYGWIELTRGSITSGRAGFQNTPFAPAPIPAAPAPMPEPGSLALLATGAAGLVSMRRRKRNAAVK